MYVLAKKFGNEKISRKDGFSEVLTEGKESLFASSTRKFIGFKKRESCNRFALVATIFLSEN